MTAAEHDPPRLPFRCASALAEAASRLGIGRPEFDADALRRWAERRTGLTDWGEDFGHAALERLLGSARDDARLTALGAWTLDGTVRAALRTWLRQVRACEARGVRGDTPFDRPVAVIGMPRSGTTRLHHLLAAHPDSMHIPLWLALTQTEPVSRREWARGGGPARRWWARGVAGALNAAAPSLEEIHAYAPDLPVEDTHLTFTTFQSNQWGAWPLYSYIEWLRDADPAGAYRALRRHLHLVQGGLPERRWVLKSPGHFAQVDAFAQAFPEALLVVLHRDPREVFSSLASLMAAHFAPLARGLDLPRFERAVIELFARGAEAWLRVRETEGHRMVEIHGSDLRGDPVVLAERLFVRAGWRWDDEVRAAIRAHVPVSQPDRHQYALIDGVEVERVRQRFGAYAAAAGIGLG